ncbi:hypothetical protein QFZ31_005779 [Neobacillus niacini]|uniref:hypothetical protein n=1 Tax=Neobacillus driksii TaxID=3035913 RepID=UPI002780B65A|nr:hypothetical protein [Neobacillus niacini]MDQ0975901.1 hypothetical protein [Neobacillus niacini]
MSIEPRELLLKMKQYEFVYDTKIGQVMNPKADEDKEYVLKILDLLYKNFDRVRYIDDMGSKYTGKGAWAVMLSQKFALLDKRIPIPQVPFHIKIDGKNDLSIKTKHAYLMLVGFFKESDNEICVCL